MLSSGVFRRETASGFYPWGKVENPRKRVAEGLCGWRHGNSFPMTQSTQSHRQMRSIPLCSKAVFYVFVFDSIHDSATMQNQSPGIFHWSVASLPYKTALAGRQKKEMGVAQFSLGAHPFPRHITCLNSLGAYSSSVWNTGISRIKLSSSEISVSVAFTPEMCWILSLSSSIKCWLSRA